MFSFWEQFFPSFRITLSYKFFRVLSLLYFGILEPMRLMLMTTKTLIGMHVCRTSSKLVNILQVVRIVNWWPLFRLVKDFLTFLRKSSGPRARMNVLTFSIARNIKRRRRLQLTNILPMQWSHSTTWRAFFYGPRVDFPLVSVWLVLLKYFQREVDLQRKEF